MERSTSTTSSTAPDVLVCPVCRTPFLLDERVFVCAEGHSFDVAREGYVNLLTGKGSGDTAEMLAARRRVLGAGNYLAVTEAVVEIVASETGNGAASGRRRLLLDAGCGEGHYVREIAARCNDAGREPYQYIGLDSSRAAIKMAAARSREHLFVVADVNRTLPLADSSVHVLLSGFAPRNAVEFARVVVPGGVLIVVIPQSNHLEVLRSLAPMLRVEENKEGHLRVALSSNFDSDSARSVEWQMQLRGEEVADLVRMTPSFWHLDSRDREKLSAAQALVVEGKVRVLVFRRS